MPDIRTQLFTLHIEPTAPTCPMTTSSAVLIIVLLVIIVIAIMVAISVIMVSSTAVTMIWSVVRIVKISISAMGVLTIGKCIPDWTWLKISSDGGSATGRWGRARQ